MPHHFVPQLVEIWLKYGGKWLKEPKFGWKWPKFGGKWLKMMINSSKTAQISGFWAVFSHILPSALKLLWLGHIWGTKWGTKRAPHFFTRCPNVRVFLFSSLARPYFVNKWDKFHKSMTWAPLCVARSRSEHHGDKTGPYKSKSSQNDHFLKMGQILQKVWLERRRAWRGVAHWHWINAQVSWGLGSGIY